MSKPIQIVDEDDQPIAQATKQGAWDKGLRHRVIRIMIENDDGQVLLQHRSPKKDIFPDCRDNSAAGHVDAGEDYKQAALRELQEELGLDGIDIQEVRKYVSDETWRNHRLKRFTTVYKAHANVDVATLKLEEGKVDDARWFTISEVRALVSQHPDQASDGLRQVFERYYINR